LQCSCVVHIAGAIQITDYNDDDDDDDDDDDEQDLKQPIF